MPEENDNMNELDAIQAIKDISDQGKINTDLLIKINTDLQNISDHVASLDDYLVLRKIELEKIEKDKKVNESETKETTQKEGEVKDDQTRSETITLTEIHADLQTINENIEMTNYISVGQIVFIGVLVGAVLFNTFWERFKK